MSQKLIDLLERVAGDEKLAALLKDDPAAAAAHLGWKPDELGGFELADIAARNCGSVCGCASDSGRGCATSVGGRTDCPSGRPGSVKPAPGEGPDPVCTLGIGT